MSSYADYKRYVYALESRVLELETALQNLMDVQNGSPLPSYDKDWADAMRLGQTLLASKDWKQVALSSKERPCTCHPDNRPEVCQQKYAASECQKAAALSGTIQPASGTPEESLFLARSELSC